MTRTACFFAPFFPGVRCSGPWDRCHLGLDKQFLRLQGLDDEAIWDERIWRPGCRGHHERSHWPTFHMERADLPASVEEFAAEYGLGWRLDRDLGPR